MHIIPNNTFKKNYVKLILPLLMTLLQGIKKMFGPLLDDLDCQLAAAFHPRFHLKWLQKHDPDHISACH